MIKVYKTFEIIDDLWQQIADGFNESFEGHHATIDYLKNGFCVRNPLGYAYHAIDFDDETHEIRGYLTHTPTLYKNGLTIFIGGSTFVRKKYRKDIFIFYEMSIALKRKGLEDGIYITLGVPNQNALTYSLKFLKSKLIGYLDYYILPLNISRCIRKSYLRPVDYLSMAFLRLYVSCQVILSYLNNSKEDEVKYSLVVDDEFYKARFGSPVYQKYKNECYSAYYHMVDEDGIKTAYLMDFRENGKRTKRALAKAVKHILKNEQVDAILFVGFLRLSQHILFKVPKKFVPKPLPLTYLVFDKTKKDDFLDMADKNNWNFSLMNFDVR